MNRKSVINPYTIGGLILLFFFIVYVLPQFFQSIKDISCENEKKTIGDLNSKLSKCQTDLSIEQQKTQQALNDLTNCQNQLSDTKKSLKNCTDSYNKLEEEYKKKEQSINQYYFVKVYSNKITLFDLIVIYHIESFFLFLSFGVTFTIKLFEIDIEIKVLNKKNQRKLVRMLREYLIEHPWTPVLIIIAVITITNVTVWLFSI